MAYAWAACGPVAAGMVGKLWKRMTVAAFGVASAFGSATADAAKRDFRGIEPGMSVSQAVAAAGHDGLVCETSFTGSTGCRGVGVSVTLRTTGRNANHVYELQIILLGHFEVAAMMADLTRAYGLRPTEVPQVYATAAGQQLMLLETGGSQTVFYLIDDTVLRDDAAALPPPKL